ncbi:MAG: aromatic amino acid transporter AroP, partial [Bartonella sp.]|nr:aromatic amino acid transporter AroP [Bartonella sp.]
EKSFVYAFSFYPYANYLCLFFLALLFCIMFVSGLGKNGLITQLFEMIGIKVSFIESYIPIQMPDMSLAVIIIPIWCSLLLLGYKLKR